MTDAKAELTAEELAQLRRHAMNSNWRGHWLRLLDEHAARGNRLAELESALTLATEAVAAEARAKVEGLTCTREERAVLDRMGECDWRMLNQWQHKSTYLVVLRELATAELARREAAKAKGDGNG